MPTGKTGETVKEQVCFTPSGKRVNVKAAILSALFSVEYSASTAG
jgi:hypothetical protein